MNRYCCFDKFSWKYGEERREAGTVSEGNTGTRGIWNRGRFFFFFLNNGSNLRMCIGKRRDSKERGV